jgi:hypothetical protein
MRRVGDKVELVGKIVSVKEGIGRRGRGSGLPYVFINFGPWNQESVKITIWSEGLGNLSTLPTQSWVGNWISVTGLVDPPYEGRHYGRPYTNVGIAVVSDNQILRITEQDAKFRLGRGGAHRANRASNADILTSIRSGSDSSSIKITGTRTQTKQTASPLQSNPQTRNQQILNAIQTNPSYSSSDC